MDYQYNYTDNPVAKEKLYDQVGRKRRAEKILAVLSDYLGDLSTLRLLDMSCSTGIITEALAWRLKEVVGIDIDEKAVAYAQENFMAANLSFQVMDGLHTDFPDESFDLALCNQMYEHVPDAKKLMEEIHRLLTPGGVCYFGATNRLNIFESHYGRLPFLSWLPKPLGHVYLRLLGKSRYYYETHYTLRTLKKLTRDFKLIDYTERVVGNPAAFKAEDMIPPGGRKQRLARIVLKHAYWFFPGYIWLLEKPATGPKT